MRKLRALIVDDEPFARERVRRLLASDEEIEIVGECADGFAAVAVLAGQEARAGASAPLERVVVKSGGRIFFLKTAEVDWIEAYGNYVRLHTGPTSYLLREPISSLAQEIRGRPRVQAHVVAVSLDPINLRRLEEEDAPARFDDHTFERRACARARFLPGQDRDGREAVGTLAHDLYLFV